MKPAAPKPPPVKALSVGSPNEGKLVGGVHVDMTKRYYRVVPAYVSGDIRWGLPQLVNMIDRAARTVHKRFPGSVLDVGDLSQKGGGDLNRHHSHESGRDADLGFYAVDAKGRQVHANTFVKFDGTLTSTNVHGARFDLARNWAFVEQLVTDPGARVSHIFIAQPLRDKLLAFARGRVSKAIFDRAAIAMMQPTKSMPHDDHFHVRISCPPSMKGVCIELAKDARAKKRMARKAAQQQHKAHKPSHPPLPIAPKPAPKAAAVAPHDPFGLTVPPPPEPDVPDVVEGDIEGEDEGDSPGKE